MPAGPAPATGCSAAQLEAGLGLLELAARAAARPGRRGWSRGRRRRPLRPRPLEAVEGAEQVGLHRVGGVGEAGQDRGLGRALDHRVERHRRPSRSAGSRTSPWTNSTPASRSRGRFSSEPRRIRLSRATISQSGWRSARATREVAADEAGAAGDQDAHRAQPARSPGTACRAASRRAACAGRGRSVAARAAGCPRNE